MRLGSPIATHTCVVMSQQKLIQPHLSYSSFLFPDIDLFFSFHFYQRVAKGSYSHNLLCIQIHFIVDCDRIFHRCACHLLEPSCRLKIL